MFSLPDHFIMCRIESSNPLKSFDFTITNQLIMDRDINRNIILSGKSMKNIFL